MSSYRWKTCRLKFDDIEEKHQKITKIVKVHLDSAEKEYERNVEKVIDKGTNREKLQSLVEFTMDIYDKHIAELKKDIRSEKYYFRLNEICSNSWNKTLAAVEEIQVDILNTFNELDDTKYEKQLYRQRRKENRSYWTGFGLGIEGAIKGAVEAQMVNVASGAAHTAVNTVANWGTNIRTNCKEGRLIVDGYHEMENAFSVGFGYIYNEFLKSLNLENLYTDKMLQKHRDILNQYKDDDTEKAAEKLFYNIKTNPYDSQQYRVLIRRYGDESKIFERLGETCGIDINGIKKEYINELCKGLPAATDKDTAENNYTTIQEKKKWLGYTGSVALEKETLKAIERYQGTKCDSVEELKQERSLRVEDTVHDSVETTDCSRTESEKISECEQKTLTGKESEVNNIATINPQAESITESSIFEPDTSNEYAKKTIKGEENTKSGCLVAIIITIGIFWGIKALFGNSKQEIQTETSIVQTEVETPIAQTEVETFTAQSEKQMVSSQSQETFDHSAESIQAEETYPGSSYYILQSDTTIYSAADLIGMDKDMLRLARNEIYARHGRKFDSADLQEYFNAQSWYNGYIEPKDFDESVLNDYERSNLYLIKKIEDENLSVGSNRELISGLYRDTSEDCAADFSISVYSSPDEMDGYTMIAGVEAQNAAYPMSGEIVLMQGNYYLWDGAELYDMTILDNGDIYTYYARDYRRFKLVRAYPTP